MKIIKIINNKIVIKKMKEKEIKIKKALAESIFNLKEFDLAGIKLYSDVDLNSFNCVDMLGRNVFQINSDGNFINPENGIYKSSNSKYEIEIIDGRIIDVYM